MASHEITEFDLFFLSYDEPNAEKHWAHLLDQAPWAQRVHGVKGFDAAHRACAEQSTTDWFVTVDADNIVRPEFFSESVELDAEKSPNRCYSWNGVNMHNGLMYGNGGLKLWSKSFVLNMNTHENADDPRKAVDFCWERDYQQVYKTFSEVWVTGSPYQAFRVGYREGVKLTLDRGQRVAAEEMRARLHPVNLRNVRIWSCIGADQPNGIWAMLGTRAGWLAMCDPEWDHTVVRDYDWFKTFWAEFSRDVPDADAATCLAADYGREIAQKTRLPLPMLDAETSEFFRETFKLRND